jgi:hypothetical protein
LFVRLNVLPDPAFLDLKPVLAERLQRLAESIHAPQLQALLDPLMLQALQRGFAEAGADEGTVWLLDESAGGLEPAYNTGPHAQKLVGHFKQPLNSGLICMVFATEQPFLENEVSLNTRQSKLVDSLLQVETYAMIAVPFYFLQSVRGVVSCVQLRSTATDAADPSGFRPEHLASVQRTTALVSQLIEFRLLGRVVGWTSD